MHPFATHLITALVAGIVVALYANHVADKRDIASFHRGRQFERDLVAVKHSERGKKAAATRRSKS